jgi:plastocyanin
MAITSYRTGILIAATTIFVMATILSSASLCFAQTASSSPITTTPQTAAQRVAVGQGSTETVQYYTYTPQSVEINVGESVTWFSPAEFADIHTVTFVRDPNIQSDIILPFAVSVGENFELLEPFNTGNPLLIQAPDGRDAIVGLNKDGWYPTVMDANNQTTYLNGTDIHYTIQGTEKLVNSGIILPPTPPAAGVPQLGPSFPPVNSFTVTFAQPGTYPYFCAIHPWMSGEVIVREGGGLEVGNQATTGTPSSPISPFSAELQRQQQQQSQQQPQMSTQGQLSDTIEPSIAEEEEEDEGAQQQEVEEVECDPSYPDVCIPPPPPNLNCGDISERRFTVLPPDPHGFDGRDNDGIGCES